LKGSFTLKAVEGSGAARERGSAAGRKRWQRCLSGNHAPPSSRLLEPGRAGCRLEIGGKAEAVAEGHLFPPFSLLMVKEWPELDPARSALPTRTK
jgi:hypothetical protein